MIDRRWAQAVGSGYAVSVLLSITILVGIFSQYGNRRAVDFTSRLRPSLDLDNGANHGNSSGTLEWTDSVWRFGYRIRSGFAFPYVGAKFGLDTNDRDLPRDFGRFDRIRLVARQSHSGQPYFRIWIHSERIRDGKALVVPSEITLNPGKDWTDKTVDLRIFRIPNWWIWQNGLELEEQQPRFDDVLALEFMTPELLPPGDSGSLEIRSVVLEGDRVPTKRLMLGLLSMWMGWGVLFLFVRWRWWANHAIEASDRAFQAEEIARAKTEFLATMNHEIRTPLNGMIVPAQLLEQSELDAEQKDHARTIVESGNHLMAIVQDALDFAKIEAGKLELESIPFRVGQELDAVRRIFDAKAREKGLELSSRIAPDVPEHLVGDPLRLRQILLNLVSNSLKFTSEGSVRIEVRWIGGPDREDRIVFEVSDTGIGMDETTCRKLFGRFAQAETSTARKFGGSGLGLSISLGLVEAMGGRLEARSRPGEGSCFSFSIPCRAGVAECGTPSTEIRAFQGAGKRVLVVDDNQVNLKVAGSMLAKFGCEVLSAASGPEALRILETNSVDMVLMDCHMDGMDGFETTRIIRSWSGQESERPQAASKVPIVALTADAVTDIHLRCRAAGMDGVVTKPFRREHLVAELDKWLGTSSVPPAPRSVD